MFNKSKKHINVNSEKVLFSETNVKFSERTLLAVIGQINLQKWNDVKDQLCCKTNEEFVTKLLAIAQDFLNRYVFT